MIPVRWRFECRSADCLTPRRSRARTTSLEADGSKAQAIKIARAAGWRPCHELTGGTRRLTSWWCPACVGWWVNHKREQDLILSRLQGALGQNRVRSYPESAKLPSTSTTGIR